MDSTLTHYIKAREALLRQVPADRREVLDALTRYVKTRMDAAHDARAVFVCTHNSRRSHMAQIWARCAADHYAIPAFSAFSGGTESTAFHTNAVAALRRAGFTIERTTSGDNPLYRVESVEGGAPIEAFSKLYSDPPNPSHGFCAVMTCSDAERECPTVPGADLYLSLNYRDPKVFDGTDAEQSQYDARCRQIATEMLYVFARVRG